MPAVPDNAPSSTTTSNGVDCEPDEAWKQKLRKEIEEGLQSMVADAKENHATELSKAPDTPEARMRLEADYKQAMQTIKSLASEQYKLELDRERNQRRWTAGVPMTPGWSQYFRQEQQNIMNSIKQSNQTDNSVRTASESPTEERRSAAISKPSNEPPALAPTTTPVLLPVPPSPSVRPTEEREKSFVSPPSVRRGSDVRSTLSVDRDDIGSFRRSHHASIHVRPGLPENWVASETVEEPEELIRSPPPRARLSSIDKPSQPSPVSPDNRWDGSLGRSSGSIHSAEPRSPPRAPPEVWKPAISPAEDTLPAKHYNLARRGSSASMRSTGSGASIRPSITETIPERADDDGPDESDIEENDYGRAPETTEQGRAWISTADKSRDKEKRPHLRRSSRQSPVDAGLRSDDLGSSSLRSDDRHRPIESPGKPPPYYDYREQSSSRDDYAHRDQHVPLPPLDPRPIPARSSYGDERDYSPQYSTPHRPHGPKPPPYHPQRESRPISRQVSFTRQLHIDLDDDNDEREIDRGGRDRERHLDREYDRDRERDGGRDIHSDPRRSTTTTASTYPYTASRHSPYPNPSTPGGSSRPVPPPQDYDDHEDWEGAPGSSFGRYSNYRGLPPPSDTLEYQRRPDSARPGPGLSRQSSYVRPRDEPDRRFSGDNDGYSRHIATSSGGIPIPRHTPNLEEPLVPQQQPAWRDWAAESNRHHLNYEYHQQARSPPPNAESFPSPRRFTHPPQSYSTKNSPHDDRPTTTTGFGGRETNSLQRGGKSIAADEYDSANEDTDSEEDDEDEDEGEDGDSSEKGIEAKRLRDLEARKQMLEENRREADDELKRMELEIQQLAGEEARKKKEEADRREEAKRKEEEAKRREEDARRKEEEISRMEEEVKRKEEDAARKAEEAKQLAASAKKKEEDAKKKEREARLKEQDAKRKEEAARRKVEEARQKAEELSRKEEEAKQREAQLEQDTEKTKQMQLETQKIAEDLKKKEEEAHRKDLEMQEREDILRRREAELMRREADNFRREEEAKRKQEEALAKQEDARKREELQEMVRKDEEAKQEAVRRKEETRKEKARQEAVKRETAKREEEARRAKAKREEEEVRKEETRKREEALQEVEREEARKKAAEAKREEDNMKRKIQAEEAKRKADEAAKRREEELKREEARLEDFRREQEEKRLQNENQHFEDLFLDLDANQRDPKFMDEQVKVLQQAGFRKREEDIRRTREERKRNDSVGNDNAWSNPSYLSNSPGTSPSMSKSPQFNGQPVPERSAGPSTGGWSAGPSSAWNPSIKPTAAAASPTTTTRSSASTSTGKPRTGSVSSGTYPTSSSPHTATFTEAERTRKQQEFAESQQEQFRRAQEKLEAERQLKSAGRPLSREELQRVFEHHERLWTRLNTLNELSWNDFPWPMAKPPSNPDDMSLPQISSYIQSPLYPDKDKSRTPKDRIKEHIKRWHPDRFETKLLPKVVDDEREKVKHGAGNVARYLSDLLRKENESININNIFGD